MARVIGAVDPYGDTPDERRQQREQVRRGRRERVSRRPKDTRTVKRKTARSHFREKSRRPVRLPLPRRFWSFLGRGGSAVALALTPSELAVSDASVYEDWLKKNEKKKEWFDFEKGPFAGMSVPDLGVPGLELKNAGGSLIVPLELIPRDPMFEVPEYLEADFTWEDFELSFAPPPKVINAVGEYVVADGAFDLGVGVAGEWEPLARWKRSRRELMEPQPELSVDFGPNGIRFRRSVRARRTKRGRDRKKKGNLYVRALALINKTWGRASEALEMATIAVWSIESDVMVDGEYLPAMVVENKNVEAVVRGLFEGKYHFNMAKFVKGAAMAQLGDLMIGKLSQGTQAQLSKGGRDSLFGVTAGPAL